MQNFYSRSWGIGKDVQNGGIESEGVHRYVERLDSLVAKKAYSPGLMKKVQNLLF